MNSSAGCSSAHVLMLPDFDRADRIGAYYQHSPKRRCSYQSIRRSAKVRILGFAQGMLRKGERVRSRCGAAVVWVRDPVV
jgi:hypothetical protein